MGIRNIVRKFFSWDLLICIGISIVLYYPTLNFPAFSDDFSMLFASRNGHFQNWFSTRYMGALSIYLEYLVFGKSFFYHHAFSLIYHGIAGVLCLQVGLIIFKEIFHLQASASTYSAWCVTLLFLIYPFHLEAVFWISGRQIILAVLFGLLSTYFFLKASSFFTFQGLLAVIFYVAALLSYESILPLPFIWIFIASARRYTFCKMLPFAALGLIYPILEYFIGTFDTHTNYLRLSIGIEKALKNLAALLFRHFTFPAENTVYFLTIAGLFLFMHFYIFRSIFRNKEYAIQSIRAVGVLVLCVLPFLLMGIDIHDFESGRFLYFSSVVYLILLVGGLSKVLSINAFSCVIGILLIYFISFNRIVLNTWQISADLVRSSLSSLPVEKRNIFIDNVPDSYRGAFIFRNGLKDAFRLSDSTWSRKAGNLLYRKVNWEQFLSLNDQVFRFSNLQKQRYISDLRRYCKSRQPKGDTTNIYLYTLTSKGIVYVGNLY
jgi:hypothetical protein